MKPNRRSHTKSRWGCLDCKQRHMKCDETRPVCVNCGVVGRTCSYITNAPSIPIYPQPYPPRHGTPESSHAGPETLPPANMAQMDLFNNIYATNMGLPRFAHTSVFRTVLVDTALQTPFLMNEMLSFSSRHLAEVKPARAAYYRHQALQLQTHALRLFNEAHRDFESQESCLGIFFFSWLIGTHMLCDVHDTDGGAGGGGGGGGGSNSSTPASNSGPDLDILNRFTAYMQTYRGVRAVAASTWSVILTTNISKILHDGHQRLDHISEGPETEMLRKAISNIPDLSTERLQACDEAIARIQWALNLYRTMLENIGGSTDDGGKESSTAWDDNNSNSDSNSIVSAPDQSPRACINELMRTVSMWPLAVQPPFFDMVLEKRPEALVVLAYVCVVFFWCRDIWIVGDLGTLLLDSIAQQVPPEWQGLLEWPTQVIRGGT